VAYNIVFDSVSINAVHLYLSVSRSIDGGPAFFTRENLVPHFPVPRFLPMRFGPAFSSPAFSTHAIWSRIFQSRVFHPRTFHGPPFSIPAFSASPGLPCAIFDNRAPCGLRVERIEPLRFLVGCRKRRLNQAVSVLSLRLGSSECVLCLSLGPL